MAAGGTWNINSGYGQWASVCVANGLTTFGKMLLVMPTTDPNWQQWSQMVSYDPDGELRLFTTLEDAYAAATSNENDVILLSANSSFSLTGMLTWSKNRIHVVGLDGGDRRVDQGTKISIGGTLAAAAVLKVTGTRNSFRNIKFIQGSTDATALNVVIFAGEGNLFKNCSFLFSVTNNLSSTSATEALVGEDSGTFVNCSFGTDVILSSASTGRAVITLAAVTGAQSADGAKSNRFVDCETLIMSSSANAVLIKLAATSGAKFLNKFVNHDLMAIVSSGGGGVAITNAIASAAGFVDGSLVFVRPTTANCTNGCAGVTDHVVVSGAPVFGAGTWEGGTPT